jgi:hypothetical protein
MHREYLGLGKFTNKLPVAYRIFERGKAKYFSVIEKVFCLRSAQFMRVFQMSGGINQPLEAGKVS